MFDWAWAYFTYRRSIRLITGAEADTSTGDARQVATA